MRQFCDTALKRSQAIHRLPLYYGTGQTLRPGHTKQAIGGWERRKWRSFVAVVFLVCSTLAFSDLSEIFLLCRVCG